MNYPIVILPDSFLLAKQKNPTIESPPTKPKYPTKSYPNTIIPIVGMLLGLYLWGQNSFLSGSLLMAITILIYIRTKKKFVEKHDHKVIRYEQSLLEYNIVLDKYEKDLIHIQEESFIKEYRYNELLKEIKKTQEPETLKRVVEKGKFEDIFEPYLIKWFGGQIFKNLEIGHFNKPYVPDFAYIDSISSLHIDIEIDEPYSASSKEPIHYLGADTNRNRYFTARNWIVIRFAEEQIAQQPNDCCALIAKTISDLMDVDSDCDIFEKYENVRFVSCWTYEDSKNMMLINFRNKYNSND